MGGIRGYGVYIPKYRIKREEFAKVWGGRARGENSVAYTNEDNTTMAVEASLNAIEQSGVDPLADLDAIYLATNSSPYIEHSLVTIIGHALGVKPQIHFADFTSSTRAGTAALKACLDAIGSGRVRSGLVIATECRPTSAGSEEEAGFGVGAVAWVISATNTIADIEADYSYSTHFIDTWRSAAADWVTSHEPRFTRDYGYRDHIIEAVKGLLGKTEKNMADFGHVVYPPYFDERVVRGLARALGTKGEQLEKGSVSDHLGDTGVVAVFLAISAILDQAKPGERILASSYGSGSSDAFSLVVKEGIEQSQQRGRSLRYYLNSKEYIDYLTFAKWRELFKTNKKPLKMGVSPLSPQIWREAPEFYQLVGAKCLQCSYINFPPSLRSICIRCGNTDFERVPLGRTGKIHAGTWQLYAPPGLESPLPLIIADLDSGARYRAMGTEMKQEEIKIGAPVELVLRNIGTEEGVSIYAHVFRFSRQPT